MVKIQVKIPASDMVNAISTMGIPSSSFTLGPVMYLTYELLPQSLAAWSSYCDKYHGIVNGSVVSCGSSSLVKG